MIKYMDIKAFREEGYLHELNRRFLHPLGLALEITINGDGNEFISGVWDYRDDPEGIAFSGPVPSLKAEKIDREWKERETKRVAALGFMIQPVEVDRNDVRLTNGQPVTDDHREIDPGSGQQKGYVVLSDRERAKGFVRPFRDAYRHLTCGAITTMGRVIAETYARDPYFYSGTFCTKCRSHFPVGEDGEFTWYEMDGSEGPKVGT